MIKINTENKLKEDYCCNICKSKLIEQLYYSVPDKEFFQYICPNFNTDWHKQAFKIKEEAIKTPSKLLENLLLQEFELIIREKHTTKTLI